jgi:tetratricopeptide (TPR) repeat protein
VVAVNNTRRRLNVRFLIGLLAVVVVLGLGVHFLHAYQVRQHIDAVKERGDYTRALTYNPDDTESRLARADALESKDRRTAAEQRQLFADYEYVLLREKDRHDVRRRQVQAALNIGRVKDAITHLDYLLQEAFPNDGELEQLLASCYERQRDYEQAVRWYQKAIEHAPNAVPAYVGLARVLQTHQYQPEQADQVMEDLVDKNPDNAEARLARANHLRMRGGPIEEVAKEVGQAQKTAPDEAATILAAAKLALSQGHLDEAREHLRRGLELHPENPEMYRTLANLETQAKRLDEALAALEQGLEKVPEPGRTSLLHYKGSLLVQQGKLADAEAVIAELRKKKVARAFIDELNARILMHQGQWLEATRLLEKLRPLVAANPEFSGQVEQLLGYCFEKRGETEPALAHYREALTLNPESTAATLGLASVLATRRQWAESLAEYQKILPKDPALAPRVAHLMVLINLNLPPEKRNWAEVNQVLDQAAQMLPDATEVPILRAEVLVAQGQAEEAQSLLEAARDAQPTKVELWRALASVWETRGQPEKGLETLDQAVARLGDRLDLRLARAAYWSKPGREGAAEALAKLEEDSGKFTVEEETQLLRGLAGAQFRVGNFDEARRLWTQVAAKQPKDLGARLVLFDLASQAGDEEALDNLVHEIRAIEGEAGADWRYAKATRLIAAARKGDKHGLAEANTLLGEVAALRPTWAAVRAMQAEVQDLEGNQPAAIDKYRQAIALGERSPGVFRRIVQLLSASGQYAEAAQLLAKLQEQGPLAGDLLRLQAVVNIQNQDMANAIAVARQPIDAGSKDPREHAWLAQVLAAAGQNDEATQRFAEATQLEGADKLAEVWVWYVQFLARTAQAAKAQEVIQEAEKKLAKEIASSVLADCFEALNQLDKAEAIHRAALEAKPNDLALLRSVANFYMRHLLLAKAEPLLTKILEPGMQAPQGDVLWARRGLAMRMALAGDYQQFLRARQLIEQNIKEGGGAAEDLRAKASILAVRASTQPEAVRILEEQQRTQPPTPDQQLLLADLYEKTRQWPKARDIYRSVGMQSNQSAVVALCAGKLLRHDELGGAAAWLDRLQKLEPESPHTLEIHALVLAKAQGRPEEAGQLLTAYAQKPDANLDWAAALLEEAGQLQAAEELHRKLLAGSGRREKIAPFVAFLSRHDRTQEALDLCDEVWKSGTAEQAAALMMGVLHAAKPATAQECKQAERRLLDALAKEPSSLALLIHLAALRQLQQDYPEAETIYRRILSPSSRSPVVLNNLAWLVALRGGKTDEALALINEALNLAGPASALLDTRAVVQLARGKAAAAIDDCRVAIQETPSAIRYFHLARAQLMAKDRRAAAASFKEAQALNLTRESVHPLEQAAYDRLIQDLGIDPTGGNR